MSFAIQADAGRPPNNRANKCLGQNIDTDRFRGYILSSSMYQRGLEMVANKGRYVVLGATGGIGSTLARRLSERGVELWLGGRDASRLDSLSRELGASAFVTEARDPESIEAGIARAADSMKGLDGVVNCFGTLALKPAHLTSWETWEETITVNLSSSFAAIRSAVRPMRSSGGGSIVLLSTAAARMGLANHEAIAAAKAGIQGLALSAAATYASWGVRVNVVAPGLVRTPLAARITGNEAALKASVSMHALGRIGEPSEVASCIDWLLRPEQSWVTGQVFGIDGGLSTLRTRA